jgi:2-oxoglutarate dehydrogenase E2 component (dihydrolipoamide succinyltransferase)
MADIEMPQLGETVTEGTITKWFKTVGDQIAEDEVLFEVSTDKVDSEVPSPVAGFVTEIRVPEGDTVDVGTVLAVVADAPPAGGSAAPPEADAEPAAAAPAPASPAPAAAAPAPPPPPPPPPAPVAAPPAAPPPPPPPPPVAPAPVAPAPAAGPVDGAVPAGGGLVSSPLVRRLIADHGLDPATIAGSGIGGRITRGDVERAIEAGGPRAGVAASSGRAPAATATTVPAAAPRRAAPAPRSGTGDTVEKLNNIRRITGEHMVMSKATSPHAMTAVEVDYENVERVRRAHRDEFEGSEGFSLTYLPFISRAVIDALRDYPHMNASVGVGELVVHNYVNLAIAVDLDFEGLLAPVIHDADDKRLRAIARDISDLATRARTKKLSADDISGGTFTISNSGPFGTFMVIPVINQPQVAILSTDGITRKPVVVTDAEGNEAIAIHSVGMLALSWDHRAFDGAYAAAFLREVKEILETRDWAAELA